MCIACTDHALVLRDSLFSAFLSCLLIENPPLWLSVLTCECLSRMSCLHPSCLYLSVTVSACPSESLWLKASQRLSLAGQRTQGCSIIVLALCPVTGSVCTCYACYDKAVKIMLWNSSRIMSPFLLNRQSLSVHKQGNASWRKQKAQQQIKFKVF